MTGRFSHLEFNEGRRRREAQQTGAAQPSAENFLGLADEEYRWGRFERALQFFTRCLGEDRGAVRAWVGQVQMLVQLGECHEARLWSDKALELFRNNGELLAAKAQACVRLGDTASGQACCDASLQAVGSSPWRWEVRGEVLLAGGETLHETCFKKALAEPGADWFDRVIIANMCLFYRRAAAAFEYARQATELSPQAGYAWFVLGNTQRQLGLAGAAMTSYRRCLEIRPGYAEARSAIAQTDAEPFLARLWRWLGWR
jgi:tetratricopeptide (TPR) repeat protein